MSSSTITLYYLRKSFAGKNLVVEDLNDLLSDSTYIDSDSTLSIANFQYLRLQKEMTIKISAMQEISEPTNQTWNYCRIIQDGGYTYYFITNIKQIAQQTIEIHLVMDVLNTFPFSSYTLSPKTHILRRHKDRMNYESNLTLFKYYEQNPRSSNFIKFINGETASGTSYNILFSIDYEALKTLNSTIFDVASGYSQQVNPYLFTTDNTSFTIYVVNGRGEILENYEGSMILFSSSRSVNLYTGTTIPNAVLVRSFSMEEFNPQASNEYQKILIKVNCASYTFVYYDENDEVYVDDDTDIMTQFTYEFTQFNGVYKNGCSIREIDPYPEKINPVLFNNKEDIILKEFDEDNSWYLVYSSSNAVVSSESTSTSALYVNPVSMLLMCDHVITTSDLSNLLRYYPSDVPQYKNTREYVQIQFFGENATAGASVVVGGNTYNSSNSYGVAVEKVNNDSIYFSRVWILRNGNDYKGGFAVRTPDYTNISYIDINGAEVGILMTGINTPTSTKGKIYFSSSVTGQFIDWTSLNLTDSKLIKAINLPYSPLSYLVHYNNASARGLIANSSINCLEVEKVNSISFDRIINFDTSFVFDDLIVNDVNKGTFVPYNRTFTNSVRNKYNECESKLYNEEFYLRKFVYDTYFLTFPYQYTYMNLYQDAYLMGFQVRYVVSKNIVSRFMFELPILDEYDFVSQDYPKSLIIDRNNEKALYNNAYINYIKNGGFTYESNKNNRINAMNGLTTALSIGGAIASFASTSATGGFGIAGGIGLTTSAIASITNSIKTAHENDMSLANKMNQLASQSTSVNSSDDIDLFSAIEGNKAKIVRYLPSWEMTMPLFSLFHHYGYATNETAQPTSEMLSSRIYFNFIQAEIEFSDAGMPTEYQELIKQKWAEGITFVHRVTYNDTNTWDIDQEYENWETSLL